MTEYKLQYIQIGEVMNTTKYTLSEDDEHAIRIFKDIAPVDSRRRWIAMEKYCPYADKWYAVNINKIQPTSTYEQISSTN
jgi:hypothetical protein